MGTEELRGRGGVKDGASEDYKGRKGCQRPGNSVSETKVKLVLVSFNMYSVTSPRLPCP